MKKVEKKARKFVWFCSKGTVSKQYIAYCFKHVWDVQRCKDQGTTDQEILHLYIYCREIPTWVQKAKDKQH